MEKQKIKYIIDLLFKAEKKYKILTYSSLLFLTINSYFLRQDRVKNNVIIAELKGEVKALKKNLITYNRSFNEFPFPVWQKVKRGNHFILQYVNPYYIKRLGHMFGYDEYNLIGKNNYELGYPINIARKYYENDLVVSLYGDPLKTEEKYPDIKGINKKINVVKWRVLREKDTLIYGMIYKFIDDE